MRTMNSDSTVLSVGSWFAVRVARSDAVAEGAADVRVVLGFDVLDELGVCEGSTNVKFPRITEWAEQT